jgi:mono/diheme cytochrome c family protein
MFSDTAHARMWGMYIAIAVVTLALVGWQSGSNGTTSSPQQRGSAIFASYCSSCHGADGNGIDGRANLRKRTHIWGAHPDKVLTVLIFGAAASDSFQGSTRGAMPPMPYSDTEIASTAMYLMNTFGGKMIDINEADVERVRVAHRKATLQRLRQKK